MKGGEGGLLRSESQKRISKVELQEGLKVIPNNLERIILGPAADCPELHAKNN